MFLKVENVFHRSYKAAVNYICLAVLICSLSVVIASAATIPLVSCQPDEDLGGPDTQARQPDGSIDVALPVSIAKDVAIYGSEDMPVLAPRGWVCTYGAGHISRVSVVPGPSAIQRTEAKIEIEFFDLGDPQNISNTDGLGAQLFPKIISMSYLESNLSDHGGVLNYPDVQHFLNSGRVIKVAPTDQLRYLSESVVNYITPAQTSGIAAQLLGPWREDHVLSTAIPSGLASRGFVGLYFISNFARPVDNLKGLFILGVRLPKSLSYLSPYISQYSAHWFQGINNGHG